MITVTLLNNSAGGAALNLTNIDTTTVVTTQGVDITRQVGGAGILLVHDGTIDTLTQEWSIDDTNYYSAYGLTNVALGALPSAPNSRFISLYDVNSSQNVAKYTRFKLAGEGTITTVTMHYIQEIDV